MSYFDEYGLLNPHSGETSENGILFLYEYNLLRGNHPPEMDSIIQTMYLGDGKYCQSPYQPEDPASHDNMTAIMSFYYQAGMQSRLNRIKIWGQFWHPRDLVFFSYLKGAKWAKYFLWIVTLAQILTCIRSRKYRWRDGKILTFHATDGKLLYYVRSRSVRMPITQWLCDGILRLKYGDRFWKKIFGIYFQDPRHPINVYLM